MCCYRCKRLKQRRPALQARTLLTTAAQRPPSQLTLDWLRVTRDPLCAERDAGVGGGSALAERGGRKKRDGAGLSSAPRRRAQPAPAAPRRGGHGGARGAAAGARVRHQRGRGRSGRVNRFETERARALTVGSRFARRPAGAPTRKSSKGGWTPEVSLAPRFGRASTRAGWGRRGRATRTLANSRAPSFRAPNLAPNAGGRAAAARRGAEQWQELEESR